METYKIGDKVRILPIDGTCDDYPCGFTSNMANMAGKIMTISKMKHAKPDMVSSFKTCSKYNGDNIIYKLAEDRDAWDWHSSMFVKVSTDDTVCGYPAKDDTVNICGHRAKILQAKVSGMYYASFFVNHATRCKELHKLAGFQTIARKCHAIDYAVDMFFPKFNTRTDLLDFVSEMNAMHSSGIDRVLDRGAICGVPVPDLTGEDDQEFTSITSAELSQDLTTQYVDSLNDFLISLTPNTSNYANRLQESKTSIRRGDCPKGRKVSSRKDKVAIGIGRLSYRKCHN